MKEKNKWNKIIIASLLAAKDFDINEVNNFESLKSLFFDRPTYSMILDLINKREWEKIKIFETISGGDFSEYLDIIKFTDQNQITYIVTIYDNDELWQDPQIIEIIPLT
jgi:hypothetical protein